MTIPHWQTLMLPVLKIAAAGETSVPEAAAILSDQFNLTEAEREERVASGGKRVIHDRVYWAKQFMAKAGLIDIPTRGRFVASVEGKALLATNPPLINVQTLKRYPSFIEFPPAIGGAASAGEAPADEAAANATATPEEQIDAAHAVLHATLKGDILKRVLAQSPAFFEAVIVDLLVAMGYGGTHENAARRLGGTGDGGIDGVIDEDRLGLDRIHVQAKRYDPKSSVGRPDIQGFVGSLVGNAANKGVFVTTSTFSAPAIDFVRHLPQRVILIDGGKLADLMIEHGVGVRVARTVEVKRVDEDFFLDE